jgi:predicted metal-dependent phosphoesterase TrpH
VLIDLHTHSTASDGTDSPAELVRAARAAELDVLAITDHDTTAGWAAALEARPDELTVVTGTEFSCAHVAQTGARISLHLLGYLFDPAEEELRSERVRLRENRLGRGRAIVENMVADGVPITWGQVERFADGGAVGRPHIARALVQAGVVEDVNAAFTNLLSSSSNYYVDKADTDVFEAIRMVRNAGGVPVFAHPMATKRGRVVGDDVIAAMTDAGLFGLEVDHPDQNEAERAHLRGLAAELGLVTTGSSDYHGTNKTTPLGACTTTPDSLAAIVAAARGGRPIGGSW